MARKAIGPKQLTTQQRIFVAEYNIKMDVKAAAEKAGVALGTAHNWLKDAKKYGHVQRALEEAVRKKEAICEFKADDVMRLLQVGAFLDPRPYFRPGDVQNCVWRIKEEDYQNLPAEVARCINSCEEEKDYRPATTREVNEGLASSQEEMVQVPTGWLLVKLVDREKMIALVGKHLLGDKVDHSGTVHQINWNVLIERSNLDDDAVEQRIRQVKDSAPQQQSALPPIRGDVTNEPGQAPIPEDHRTES